MTQTAYGVRCLAILWICSFLHSLWYFPNLDSGYLLTRLFQQFLNFSSNQNISLHFTFYTNTRLAFQNVKSHRLVYQTVSLQWLHEKRASWGPGFTLLSPPSLSALERCMFLVVPQIQHRLTSLPCCTEGFRFPLSARPSFYSSFKM